MLDADEYIYVNQDGTVRELSADEIEYLSEEFHPTDGGRPYIKSGFRSRDGWGSISGFLARSKVPSGVEIEPVNPDYEPPEADARIELIEDSRAVGDIVTENPDGSVTCEPNPDIPHEERFRRHKKIQMARQKEREKLARHPDYG